MKKPFLILVLLALNSCFLLAQQSCNCEGVLETLTQKIEENYIAYHLTKETIQEDYEKHLSQFRKKVQGISNVDCTKTLQDFLRFFKDGHLFVSQFPKFGEGQLKEFSKSIRSQKYELDEIQGYLVDEKKGLSPVEGLWTDGTSKYAIIKNKMTEWSFEYVAIILDSPEKNKIGELKIGLNYENEVFEGTYFSNQYAPRYTAAFLHNNNSMLSIWGGLLWGRVDYSNKTSIRDLAPFDPKLPRVEALDKETALLSIPSFLIQKKVFDNILNQNKGLLGKVKNLIIDIRGNSGGNGIYFDLLKYYSSKPLKSEIGKALASQDNLAYFEKYANSGKNNPYAPVVEDMKKSMGQIVPGPRFSSMKLKSSPSALEKVVILTDKANISAAETFILHSKIVSEKVITMGQNTGGVVDYNNINMIKISCESMGVYFGYPMYTLHDRIPEDGYNEKGIAPDIKSEKKGDELVQFAREYLKQ